MPKFPDKKFSLTSDQSRGINIRKVEKMRWFLSQLRSFHNAMSAVKREDAPGNNFSFVFIYEF